MIRSFSEIISASIRSVLVRSFHTGERVLKSPSTKKGYARVQQENFQNQGVGRRIEKARKLGAITTFLDITVTDSPQTSLKKVSRVICTRDLLCCSEEGMVWELAGVNQARRIKVHQGEDEIQTNMIVLIFDSPKPPSQVCEEYLILDVRPCVQLPLLCYKCQRYTAERSDKKHLVLFVIDLARCSCRT
ncbi:RNA-directed DNA polymerase from mobile element jockey [Plakobranchus ocellatus]|uniref:RNA-directed DNA polymerase from mobile element jockey n=1 Tax=Plakobranchus ocellatus TaxID=259542 RepID=A0AAV3YVB4_9GAST|nr:RNA-directed DNA polymerase from mobile element jockey [Plakobranchus ocellatus]